MPDFTHLHVHSEYSLLDGYGKVDALLNHAKDLGMDSLALTDHGVLYAAIDFYLQAKEMGIKPILGLETYVAPGSRFDRKSRSEERPSHLTLLARDEVGYRNLLQLTTKAHLEGFYYRPRVDRELLAQHHDGLIALSGCASGEIPRSLINGDRDYARRVAAEWLEIFGRDSFYAELQSHDWPELDQANRDLIAIARELDVPLVATNDVHYVRKQDAAAQDLLLCIQTGTTVEDEKRMRMRGDTYYLRSPEEMHALFADLPEALANTRRIADQCNLAFDFGRVQLPQFAVPDGFTPDSYLEHLAYQGLPRRYRKVTPEVEERLRYELSVIQQTGFATYVLIVWDIVRYARSRSIPFGPRGSAAGSLVLYLLGISDVDPIANKLVFERFLNIERREMPDVDMDFADDRRDEMIEYVTQKYGREHVAQIITFGTLGAKAAIRDVGRALAMPFGDVDRVAKLVPSLPLHITIDQAMADQPQLRELYETDDAVKRLIDSAKSVEGVVRHASTHAAGVVISREPLPEVTPLQSIVKGDGGVMTQYHMNALAKIGLLKMDFLGLANLTILRRALEFVRETTGVELDLLALPQNDRKTFRMLSQGETVGIFQLEGSGMTRYLVELKPTSVDDLAAMIALFRPGPMANIPQYIARKHGVERITYPHALLEETLRDTYGVLTYQDQVLQVLQRAAGYSLGQADIVRKAMGKKVRSLMEMEHPRFVEGCRQNGLMTGDADKLWELLEPFAGYGFNRSHAACYAQVAYQTAYLKANYPAEYMAAVLCSAMGNSDKVTVAAAEARRLGVPMLGPDVNTSKRDFSIERLPAEQLPAEQLPAERPVGRGEAPLAIRFGLGAVKNVGDAPIEAIIGARDRGGPFRSISDFSARVDVRTLNKRVLESLVKAGALDSLGGRNQLLEALDRIVGIAQQTQRAQEVGQGSLFDMLPTPDAGVGIQLKNLPEPSTRERLAWEKELLGVYVSEHPLQRIAEQLAGVVQTAGEIDQEIVGQSVTIAGMLRGLRILTTKKRETMAAATLEDLSGTIEIVVFPRTFERTRDLWAEDQILVVSGKVDSRNDALQLIVEAAEEPPAPGEDRALATPAARPAQKAPAPLPAKAAAEPPRPAIPVGGSGGSAGNGHGAGKPAGNGAGRNGENGGRVAAGPRRVLITLTRRGSPQEDVELLQRVNDIVQASPGGGDTVVLRLEGGGRPTVDLELPRLRVRYEYPLMRQLVQLLGEGCVRVETPSPAQA